MEKLLEDPVGLRVHTPVQVDADGRIVHQGRYERFKELRVVDESQLSFLSQQGWELVAVLEQTGHNLVSENMPSPMGGTVYGSRGMPYVSHRFLIGRTENEVVEAARNGEMKALTELGQLRHDLDTLKSNSKMAAEELVRMTKSHEVCSKDRDRYQDEFCAMQAQKRKLEVDVGKLRIALGDLRMKEILEGAGK